MRKGWQLVKVGVRYCVKHHGIANDDDTLCDFNRRIGEIGSCDLRSLYRRERRAA